MQEDNRVSFSHAGEKANAPIDICGLFASNDPDTSGRPYRVKKCVDLGSIALSIHYILLQLKKIYTRARATIQTIYNLYLHRFIKFLISLSTQKSNTMENFIHTIRQDVKVDITHLQCNIGASG